MRPTYPLSHAILLIHFKFTRETFYMEGGSKRSNSIGNNGQTFGTDQSRIRLESLKPLQSYISPYFPTAPILLTHRVPRSTTAEIPSEQPGPSHRKGVQVQPQYDVSWRSEI